MAPKRQKLNKIDLNKLSVNDVICPLCRSILIKPITLPCNHNFCFSCFESTQNSSVVCPFCRVRVGSWLRSAKKSKKLVNETLWQAIQNIFPLQVKNKLNKINEECSQEKLVVTEGEKTKPDEKPSLDIKKSVVHWTNTNKFGTKNESKMTTNCITLTKTCPPKNNAPANEKRPNIFINNFATKEYTCRILCQNEAPKDIQKSSIKESQLLIQKKNKRIQQISQSEIVDDRSNSIESECLYFKPIDYRHNPPSKGLPPIKVPTRRPNITLNVKILAPSGQNQINMNNSQSAFVRLCSPPGKAETSKKENIQSEESENNLVAPTKRKFEKSEHETKAKKKLKTTKKLPQKSKESNGNLRDNCDNSNCKISFTPNNNLVAGRNVNIKRLNNDLTNEEFIKRSLQEQADFELATKLQQTFNQSFKYSTRSTVLKKNKVNMGEIMTPYKVK